MKLLVTGGAVAEARGLAAASLRYFNVAGASGRAHLLALEAEKEGEHKTYNLGNGAGFSVLEVIEVARQVTGRRIEAVESPRRPGDPPVLVASSDKIRAELAWRPEKADLETMIFDAWNWMRRRTPTDTSEEHL
jgi:UDP-glucose 4-epimerase